MSLHREKCQVQASLIFDMRFLATLHCILVLYNN